MAVLPYLAAWIIRCLGMTWRVQLHGPEEVIPRRGQPPRQVIYSLWHRTILANCFLYRDLGACIGVSEHADGEIGARIAQRMGFVTARGSSTRGSSRLVREMLRFARKEGRSLALTPDGPKGPLRQTKPGIIYLAGRLERPIVPSGLAVLPRKELRSWDRFVIPYPFARMVAVLGAPMSVPRSPSTEEAQELCRELDRRMQLAEDEAERLIRS